MVSDTRSHITTKSRFDLFNQVAAKYIGEQILQGHMSVDQGILQMQNLCGGNMRRIFKVAA